MANDRARFPEKRQSYGAPGSSGVSQDTVILNDFSGVTLEQRTRTSKAGVTTSRLTLSIEAQPIVNDFSTAKLGPVPANAIKDILEKQVRAIGAFVKPATIKFREKMADAFAGRTTSAGTVKRRGQHVAVKPLAQIAQERYAGGRTGAMAPGAAGVNRVGLDSGRLAGGFYVMQNPVEQSFTINVPANRFDPATWGGTMASLQAWVARFVSLVPALAHPESILSDDAFVRAVATSQPVQVIGRAGERIWRAYANAAKQSWRAFAGVL